MKNFFGEFKKFISRGNVMDMAVGTIIGAAFTAIVTALSNGILKPIINTVIFYICGGDTDALSKMYTPLVKVWELDANGNATATLDMTKSIFIDWGAFISAIINFLLVAIVLFLIVRMFNKIKDASHEVKGAVYKQSPFSKQQLKEFRKQGKTRREIRALEEQRRAQLLEEQRLAEEQAKQNAPKTQEQLLQEIVTILSEKK